MENSKANEINNLITAQIKAHRFKGSRKNSYYERLLNMPQSKFSMRLKNYYSWQVSEVVTLHNKGIINFVEICKQVKNGKNEL